MAQKTAQSLKSKMLDDLDAGKLPQALKKAVLGVKKFPGDPDYHAAAGFVLTEMERFKQAIPHFAEASRMRPDDPQFAENLANALMQTGQIPRALAYAEQKLKRFPDNAELLRVVEEIELKASNWREAVVHATKRLKSDPDNAPVLMARSRAYDHLGLVDQCRRDIERAYALAPEQEDIAFRKAVLLHEDGNKEACLEILWRILAAHEDHTNTVLKLAALAEAEDVPKLLSIVETGMKAGKGADVQLAFGKAYLLSKRDGLAAAMPQYAEANALQQRLRPYPKSAETDRFDMIRRLFPDGSDVPMAGPVDGPQPIFVVGQPRSGTTLMEMMLCAVPGVTGCGELALGDELSQPFFAGEALFDDVAAARFGATYLDLMPAIPEGARAFVDKMPQNFQCLGFLLAAFPEARAINMLRDPRDVGLSTWIRYFPAMSLRYSSSFAAIAHAANLYRRYMAHWEALFGDRVLTVSYEELVSDPEGQSRKVAAFCGLDWTEAMAHPEDNIRHVRTASIDQVRARISTKSIGGWRDVAGGIKPMLDGFDPSLWPEYDLG